MARRCSLCSLKTYFMQPTLLSAVATTCCDLLKALNSSPLTPFKPSSISLSTWNGPFMLLPKGQAFIRTRNTSLLYERTGEKIQNYIFSLQAAAHLLMIWNGNCFEGVVPFHFGGGVGGCDQCAAQRGWRREETEKKHNLYDLRFPQSSFSLALQLLCKFFFFTAAGSVLVLCVKELELLTRTFTVTQRENYLRTSGRPSLSMYSQTGFYCPSELFMNG